jgi:hypothetical protein
MDEGRGPLPNIPGRAWSFGEPPGGGRDYGAKRLNGIIRRGLAHAAAQAAGSGC